MAGGLADLDVGFPARDGDAAARLEAVYDYLTLLLENLRYILRNLTPENFNSEEMAQWVVEQTGGEGLPPDALRTDWRRAARYLAGDTSPLPWLHLREGTAELMLGTVRYAGGAPRTERLRVDGQLYYWADETRTRLTAGETDWPVTVYQYDDAPLLTLRQNAAGAPALTLELPGSEGGQGFLKRSPAGLDLVFTGPRRDNKGLYIGPDYTDVVGLRKSARLDFSAWDAGAFYETPDGAPTTRCLVDFDGDGRPVKLTDAAGHETEVVW